jgi:hypothetical protein
LESGASGETQTARIGRLGNESHIWFGQSDFWGIEMTPCWERVVVPAGVAPKLKCGGCGRPIVEETRYWGSLALAERICIVHTSRKSYEPRHSECVDSSIPAVHEVGGQKEGVVLGYDISRIEQPTLF